MKTQHRTAYVVGDIDIERRMTKEGERKGDEMEREGGGERGGGRE